MRRTYSPIEKQAKAATDAANTASETLIAANRAWIAIRDVVLEADLDVGKPAKFIVRYENVGKHPALNVATNLKTMPIESTRIEQGSRTFPVGQNLSCDGFVNKEGAAVAYPSTTHYYFANSETEFPIDQETRNGSRTFYIHGCVVYDSFDYVHSSWFCFYLKPHFGENAPVRRGFGICADGNGAN